MKLTPSECPIRLRISRFGGRWQRERGCAKRIELSVGSRLIELPESSAALLPTFLGESS